MFRPFLAVLGAIFFLAMTAGPAQSAPAQNTTTKHVWTNADIDRLRAEGLITEFTLGPAESKEISSRVNRAAAALEIQGATAATVSAIPKLQDPDWYSLQAAELNARLAEDEVAVMVAESNLALARQGRTEPGVNMFEGEPGITPESGIANLKLRVEYDRIRLGVLADLARQNGIDPGVLRS